MRAPYKSVPQLCYFLENKVINAILGGFDVLLFSPDVKVILEIDDNMGQFYWLDGKQVFEKLKCNFLQFQDAAIISGYLFGKVLDQQQQELGIQDYVNIVKSNQIDKEQYQSYFEKVKYIINDHVIFTTDCAIQFKNNENILCPNSQAFSELFGPKFPDHIYLMLATGCISPYVLNIVSSKKLIEQEPIADSQQYQDTLVKQNIIDLRKITFCKALLLELMSQCLHTAFNFDQIQMIRWFNQEDPFVIGQIQKQEPKYLNWQFTFTDLQEELVRQKTQNISMSFILKYHLDQTTKKGSLFQNLQNQQEATQGNTQQSPTTFQSIEEALSFIYFRFLEFNNYFGAQGQPMLFGKVLGESTPGFDEASFLILELMKNALLMGRSLTCPKSVSIEKQISNENRLRISNLDPNAEDMHAIVLLSRIFSLIPCSLQPDTYDGMIDYDLCQFQCMVSIVSKTQRNLLEMLFLQVFLQNRLAMTTEQVVVLSTLLPLRKQNSNVLGQVIKFIVQSATNLTINQVKQKFQQCSDIENDLKKGWEFWKGVLKMQKLLKSYKAVTEQLIQQFNKANMMLKYRLHLLGILKQPQ